MIFDEKEIQNYLKKEFSSYYKSNPVKGIPRLNEREFGFGNFGQKISSRHLSFNNAKEMNEFLVNDSPFYFSYSVAYYKFPNARPMEAKEWKGSDLVFEFDADDLKTECSEKHTFWKCPSCGKEGTGLMEACDSCGTGLKIEEWVCPECLNEVKKELIRMLDLLEIDLGLTEGYSFNFSVTGNTPVLVKKKNKDVFFTNFETAVNLYKKEKELSVLSCANNYSVNFARVTNCIEHDDFVFDLFFECSSEPISVTKDHSIYVFEKDASIIEKKTSEISEDDFLVSFVSENKQESLEHIFHSYSKKFRKGKKRVFNDKINITDEFLKFCGYYLGDGHTCRNYSRIGFTFNAKETEFINEVVKEISKLTETDFFKVKSDEFLASNLSPLEFAKRNSGVSLAFLKKIKYLKHKSKIKKESISFSKPSKNCIQVCFDSIKWSSFFKENFGFGAKNKKLPSWIWKLSNKQFRAFLQGYINSDGYKKGKYSYIIKSVSHDLIKSLAWLCNLNGLPVTVRKEKNKPHYLPQGTFFKGSTVYMLKISKNYLLNKKIKFAPKPRQKIVPVFPLKKIYFDLSKIKVKYGSKKFQKNRVEHNLLLKKKRLSRDKIIAIINWLKSWGKNYFSSEHKIVLKNYKKLIDSELGFLKIKEIKKKRKKKVYDFSVEQNENFWGGALPILLHNSGSKGFHVHIRSKEIQLLSPKARVELVDYLTANGLETQTLGFYFDKRKKAMFCPREKEKKGWQKILLNELNELIEEEKFEELAVWSGFGNAQIKRIFYDKERVLNDLNKGMLQSFTPLKKTGEAWERILSRIAERKKILLDRSTSIDSRKIVRVPNTLHGSTGLIAKELSFNELKEFNAFDDAVVFNEGELKVSVKKTPEFYLNNKRWGGFKEKEEITLPKAVAVYLLLRGNTYGFEL
ncbi:MAG: DNA primase small subunit domain-containing protein [Candidatus Diapherotrites archaeon]